MAITLVPVPNGGVSPVLNNSTFAKTFAANYYKLAGFSRREKLAIAVFGLIYANPVQGYNGFFPRLIKDSRVYSGALSAKFDELAAQASLSWNAGYVADNTIPADVGTLLNKARVFVDLSEDELWRIFMFLRAQGQT